MTVADEHHSHREGSDDELVSPSDIARLAGVTRSAVSNWRARANSTGFPTPVMENSAGPLYLRREAEEWLAARGKTAVEPLGLEAMLWTACDKLRGSIDPSNYRTVVLGLLFLRSVGDSGLKGTQPFQVPNDASWQTIEAAASTRAIGTVIDRAVKAFEQANPRLADTLPRGYSTLIGDVRRLGELVRLIGGIEPSRKTDARDFLGRVYEYFLGRFASVEGRAGGEFYTPTPIVRLLVEMIEPLAGSVYDPCCGSGGMFVQSLHFRRLHGSGRSRLKVYGQEMNPITWRLARLNLELHGIRAVLGAGPADTFHHDQHPKLRADYVLANPPFNMSDWGGAALQEDERWAYGLPPAGNANYAWLEHILARLSPTGAAGVVLANGSMTSTAPAELAIRRELIRANVVDCMIALPPQLFYSTAIPACLWFLRPGRDSRRRARSHREVLFVDARSLGRMVTRAHRTLLDDELEHVAATYHAWRNGARYTDTPGFCRSVARSEVEAARFSLAPPRYVGAADGSQLNESEDISILRATLETLLAESDQAGLELRRRLSSVEK